MILSTLSTSYINNNHLSKPAAVSFLPELIQFGASTPNKSQKQKFKWWHGSFFLSPLMALCGGVSLLTSALLPEVSNDALVSDEQVVLEANTGFNSPDTSELQINPVAQVTETPDVSEDASQRIQQLKELLKALGWGMVSISTLTDAYTALGGAISQKQPSMAASALLQAGVSPFLYLNQNISTLGVLYTAYALFFAGFANDVYNNHEKPEGAQPREMDLKPLFSPKALKALVGDESDPKLMQLAKTWSHHVGDVTGFFVKDQLRVAKSLVPFVHKGKVKKPNDENLSLFQRVTKPTSRSNEITSALMYAGGVPLMFVSGPQSKVAQVATKLYTAGQLTESTSFLAIGKEESGIKAKALLVGVPLTLVGNAIINSNVDMGAGLSMIGLSTILNYLAFLALPSEEIVESSPGEILTSINDENQKESDNPEA